MRTEIWERVSHILLIVCCTKIKFEFERNKEKRGVFLYILYKVHWLFNNVGCILCFEN